MQKNETQQKASELVIKLNFIFHICVATVNEVWKGRE